MHGGWGGRQQEDDGKLGGIGKELPGEHPSCSPADGAEIAAVRRTPRQHVCPALPEAAPPKLDYEQSPHRRRPRANPEHDLTADGRVAHGQAGICWLNVTRYLRTARHSIRALQAIEKSKERIARSVATRRTIQWCCPSERLLFRG